MPSLSRFLLCALLAAFFVAMLLPASAHGQAGRGGALGVGAHVGEPTGLSVKYYRRSDVAYDLLSNFDLGEDYLFVSGHRLWERRVPSASRVRFFHGPGLFASTAPSNDVAFGFGYTAGLSLPLDRFEVSVQLSPRLRLLPGTDFSLGGGLGLRYYFSL